MTTPARLWRIYRAASRLLDRLEEGRRSWEARRADPTTTAYASPAWWQRVLEAMRDLAVQLPLPAELQEALMTKNWKTTLAGVAAVLAVVSKVISTGTVDWQVDGPAILAGIGLILAKDADGARP